MSRKAQPDRAKQDSHPTDTELKRFLNVFDMKKDIRFEVKAPPNTDPDELNMRGVVMHQAIERVMEFFFKILKRYRKTPTLDFNCVVPKEFKSGIIDVEIDSDFNKLASKVLADPTVRRIVINMLLLSQLSAITTFKNEAMNAIGVMDAVERVIKASTEAKARPKTCKSGDIAYQ